MLAPDRMPMAEGKKMANTLKKFSSFDLQFGFRFDMKISPGDRQKKTKKKTLYCPVISLKYIFYIFLKGLNDFLVAKMKKFEVAILFFANEIALRKQICCGH